MANDKQPSPHNSTTRTAGALEELPNREVTRRLADFFSAFADKTRIRIISALHGAGELSVGEIAEIINTSESAVSHQLKLLRLLRLVTYRSEGRMAIYRLDDTHIEKILQAGLDHVKESSSI